MKRILLAGLTGGIVAFIWGNLVWMVLPFYNQAIDALPHEDAAMTALREAVPESGVYIFPSWPENMKDESAMEAFEQRHANGPIGFLVITAEGKPVMPPIMFVRGFILNLMGALILAFLLSRATALRSYWARVGFVVLIGVFISLTGPLMYWNWMYYPADYVVAMILDKVLGAFVVGLVLAAVIKPGLVRGQE